MSIITPWQNSTKQRLVKYFIVASFLVNCSITDVYAQFASVAWPLTSDAIPINTGQVSGANHSSNGVGTIIYSSNGAGADNWTTAASKDDGKYYEFAVSPNTGYNFLLTDLSIENNTDGSSGTVLIQYAYDAAFTSPANVGSSFTASTGASTPVSFSSLSVAVSNGQTLYVRVFVWDIEDTGKFFNARNVVLSGTTSLCAPDVSDYTTITPASVCEGSSIDVVINSTSLVTGNYSVTYDISGSNTASNLVATFSFTSGTPGSGIFTIPAVNLLNSGSITVTATSITSSTNCSSALTDGNSFPVTITAIPVAAFSYPASPYCSNSANPLPAFSVGAIAGTFSSTTGLVFTDDLTGEINLAASVPGNYTVTNTIAASGGCGMITATSDITITALPVAAFSYQASSFCTDAPNSLPVFNSGGAAGTFSSSAGLVFANSSTGEINIAATIPNIYTITNSIAAADGCPAVTATSGIEILPNNTITLSSAPGTDAQTKCINTAVTNITYSTTGATSATFSGLPAGVTGSWAGNIVTISGIPTANGTFNYTVTLTGGCGNITAGGSIIVLPGNTISLSSAAGTNVQTVCINTPVTLITYGTTGATGASFSGLPAGITGNWSGNAVTVSGTPTASGVFNYTVTLTGGCGNITANGSITVTPNNTITLTSAAGTNTQTKCINTAITNITYATTGATSATFSGLPAGVTGSWSGNTVTISGIPTASGTFNYSVTTTGGCTIPAVTAAGSITVTPNNTITLTSAAGTNNQVRCINTAITSITYSTTGATGAAFSGLPAGVTGVWSANTVTISGTPTVNGTFNYTVTLTGGCGAITATGSILVNTYPVANGVTICQNGSGSLTSTAPCAAPTPGTAGPAFPGTGTTTGSGTAWTNPGNIIANDNVNATVSLGLFGTSRVLSATNFGFSIPAGATITGVQATIGRFASNASSITDDVVRLIVGGISTGTDKGLGTSWTTTETAVNYGSSIDLWGTTLTPAQVNAANFGVGLTVTNSTLSTRTATVDYIQLTVSYTVAGSLNWYTVSSGGTPIGANSPFNPVGVAGSGLANTSTPGTTVFYAECAASAGCRTAVNYLINPLPSITGNLNVCIGTTSTLTGSASPAAVNPWTSSNTSVATVNSGGVVTGVGAGTSTITYTNNNGCSITATVTVLAPAISGTLSTCPGATTQLTGSGTPAASNPWQSSNTAVATITNTGLVSGITPGNTTITYTNSNGCVITANLVVNDDATLVLTSAAATTSQTLCINNAITPITYQVGGGGTGATVSGLPAGVTGTYNAGTKIYTISGTPTVSGTFNYTVTTTGPCIKPALSGTITVQANATITRTSAAATTTQTVCVNNAITNITYTTGGSATSVTVTGLPAGVTGILSGSTFTISGAPVTTAGSPFSYTVTANGPCLSASLSGTITVNADATIALTSAAVTTSQTVCVNTSITAITYLIGGGGTGATISGFPPGITGSYNSGTKVYTISGTPAASGTFNYTVTTTGPCIKPALTGTLTVTANPSITLTSAAGTNAQTICTNTPLANITYLIGGTGTGATVTTLPAGVTGVYDAGTKVFTISGTPTVSGTFNYTVTTTGPCANQSLSGSITTLVAPIGSLTASESSGTTNNDNIICIGAPVVFTATSGYNAYNFKIDGVSVQSGTANIFSSSSLANGASVTVDVANGLNCGSTFGPVVITVNPLPVPSLTASNTTICSGDTVVFTAAGGTNYAFRINGSVVQSTASNIFETAELVNGDVVSVDVTSSTGCTASSGTITINVNALPAGTVIASATEICSGENVTITAPNGFVSYQFFVDGISVQGPGTSNVFSSSFINPSVVTVDVSNGNCTAIIDTLLINVNALPSGVLTATENSGIADDNFICEGAAVNFTATPGFAMYNFRVNSISVQNSASNIFNTSTLANGDIVTVEVSNSDNCKALFNPVTITVSTSPAGALIASPAVICEGDNVNFIATAGFTNYNFKVNTVTVQNGTSNIFSSTLMVNGDVVTVEVTNNNSCTNNFNPLTITVNPLPTTVLTAVETSGIANNDGIICAGSSITFTAPSGFTNYNFLKNGISVQNGASNTYLNTALLSGEKFEVAVTNANGCIGLSNAIFVTVNALPAAVAAITGDTQVCIGDTTILSTTTVGGVWSTLNPAIATVSSPGEVTGISAGNATIRYTVTNVEGCVQFASATITVNALPAVAPIGGTPNVCIGSTRQLTNTTPDGVWSSSDNSIATVSATGIVTGITGGTAIITYTVTNVNGCTKEVSLAVAVNILPVVAPITVSLPATTFDVCDGASITVSSATAGGAWNVAPASIASVNSSGLVTGLADGPAVISYTITNGNGCSSTANENLSVHELPEPSLSGANPICPNATEVYTTEAGYFNYAWTFTGGTLISGGTSADNFIEITWDQPGTRSVFVNYQNIFGCSGSTSATLTTATGITPAITGPSSVCLNSTNTYTTQTGQTDYTWIVNGGTIISGGSLTDNEVTVVWNTAGAQSLSINFTDINGCTRVNPTSKPVLVNPLPFIVTHDQFVCSPATANLTLGAVTAGSTSGLSYTYWQDAEATISYTTPTTASSGTYYIKGTIPATGCSDTMPVSVTITTPPTASIDYPGSPVCTASSPITVDLTGSSGGVFSSTSGLSLDPGDGSITPASSLAGNYTVNYTIAAAGGCPALVASTMVTVTAMPSATISYPAAAFCDNAAPVSVTRTGTAGGTYSSSAGLTLNAATGTITPSTSTAGMYTITYTVAAAGGCAQFSTITSVTINAAPSASVSYTGSPFCSNTGVINITHSGTTGGTYSSAPGLSINSSTGAVNTAFSTAGSYTVKYTIAAAGGCALYEATTPLSITAAPIAIAGTPVSTCANNGAVNITAGAGAVNQNSVAWSSNGTGTIANPNSLTAATFTPSAADIAAGSRVLMLTVNGNAGCPAATSTKTITINAVPGPFAITPSSASICLGSVQPLSAAGGSPTTGSATFSSGIINLGIPDANILGGSGSTTSTIAVSGIPANAVINSVSVNFNVSHGYDDDLIFNLRAPNGNTLNLVRQRGGSGDNFINTTISSASVNPINAGAAPFTNTYAPDAVNNTGAPNVSNVTNFTSLFSVPNGNWIFNAADVEFCHGFLCLGGFYSGTLNSWSITINYTVPNSPVNTIWSPVTGLYTDAGGNTAYASQSLSTVYAKPLVNTTYTATASTGAGCTTSQSVAITVNPIPAVTITADYCIVPGKVRLTANSVPAATSYLWSNSATTQSIDVDVAGMYEVTAFGAGTCPGIASINVANELVINGDFSNGNDGSFTSDYNYKPDLPGLVPAGQGELFDDSGNNGYSITTSGQNVHNSFWGLDHTNGPGTRNFMAVNGHGNSLVVWKQTVAVQPNTTYYFSAWAMSLNSSGNYAQLRFSVNGTMVGTSAVLSAHGESAASPDNWTRFYGTWTSGPTTTSANIYINDLQAATSGNDFGLDDISFGSLSTFISLESAPGTDAQTVCRNTAITNIVYNVGNGSPTGPAVTGLPPGVTSSFDGGMTLTLSGTPTTSGIYTYTITTTGSCNPISATGTITVQSPTITLSSGSATTNVCVNTSASIVYTIGGTATGATVTGLPAGMAGVMSGNTYTISGTPTATPGNYPFVITTTGGACTQVTAAGTIIVRSQTITLNSVPATAAQTVCINTPITSISYAVGGTANNAIVTGLPPGITGIYNTGFVTITGTPTSAAGSPYTYTITTSGPTCSGATITGTITVTPSASITLTSAPGTNAQNACNNLVITPITYAVNNATSASITAGSLPAGVTGSFSSGVFTISGTPSVGGTFNYTITTAGGCSSSSTTGSITVQAQTVALTSGIVSPSLCASTVMTNIVFSVGGTATGASVSGLPAGVNGTYSAGTFTISGTPTAAPGAYSYTVTTSGTCNAATTGGTITIQPAATGGTIASLATCAGSNGTLTLTGHSGTIVRWESSVDGGSSWVPIINTTISNGYTNIITPTLFRVVVGNGCGNVNSASALVNIHNYWTGNTNSDWNTASNWSTNAVPSTACADVYIPGGTPNQPVINSSPAATITNLHILAGAGLTVNNTGVLQVGGVISNTGTLDITDGSVVFNGSSPQTIAGSIFKDSLVRNMTVSNPSGFAVSNAAGNYLKISGILAFGTSNTTINTGDNIVLVSNASTTASIADITNGGINSGNTFVGKVIVERFIPQRRAWRMLTVPLQQTGSQTFNAAWQEGVVNPDYVYGNHLDPYPGYGMLITGPATGAGFDPSPMNNFSVQHFNPQTLAWEGIPNTLTAKVTDSAGYMVFVRGDRSTQIYLNTMAPTSNTILRTSGFLKTNQQTTSVPAGSGIYSLVGNPFASTIDLRKITTSGSVSGTNYVVWDPALTGTNGVGAYQYLTRSGGPGTDYLVFPGNSAAGGGSYGPAFSINNNVQSGQAFLVQNAGAGTVNINENAKLIQNTSTVFRPVSPVRPAFGYISTLLLYENGNVDSLQLVDGALLMYNDDYSNDIDLEDAKKLNNFSSENFGINSNGNWMQIEKRNRIAANDTIFFKAKSYRVRDYQLKIEVANINETGLSAYLEDNYLQTATPVSMAGTTLYRFKVTVDSGAWKPDRFRIVFRRNIVLPVFFSSVKAYRVNEEVKVEWKTEHELSIANYEIERSIDGIHFNKIYTEVNIVNNNRVAAYNWTDKNPVEGFNFYRIRSNDVNGSFTYTPVVKVLVEKTTPAITLYPNPVAGGLFNLYFVNQPSGEYKLRLVNSSGQLIEAVMINHSGASPKEIFIPKQTLLHGNYILEIIKPDKTKQTISVMN